jgi:hypothetical protein
VLRYGISQKGKAQGDASLQGALRTPQWSECGETNYAAGRSTRRNKRITMGDKSPKANQKKSTQIKSKVSSTAQKKKQEAVAKQSGNKKK